MAKEKTVYYKEKAGATASEWRRRKMKKSASADFLYLL